MNDKQAFYVVATPIGNLDDITYRAVSILQSVDTILCEDTRVSRTLCDRYDITTKRESYHAHSSETKEEEILKRISEGEVFALISDAGTPTISDPGVKLVHALRLQLPLLPVISIPGPSAVTTALSGTGFMGNDFRFFGFIPHKKGRKSFFTSISKHESIAVCYESPHRLLKTLDYLSQDTLLSKRTLCVARELTKTFEEFKFGKPQEINTFFLNNPDKVRGECVIIFDRKDSMNE